MKKKQILILLSIFLSFYSFSQNKNLPNNNGEDSLNNQDTIFTDSLNVLETIQVEQLSLNMNNVFPVIKDPLVEAITIFQDIPVAHMTGIPDISIPLFTLESNGYKLPVTLRYHLDLVKPPYDHTNVATGWILEVGGAIVQQVRGSKAHDDFTTNPNVRPERKDVSELYDQTNDNVQDYLFNLVDDWYDFEYDIFKYTLPGKGGEFIINQEINGAFNIDFLAAPELKGSINLDISNNANIFLFDENGNKYTYGKNYTSNNKILTGNITRYLDSIYSPDGSKLFAFEYEQLNNFINWNEFFIANYFVSDAWAALFQSFTDICNPAPNNTILEATIAQQSAFSKQDMVGYIIKKIKFNNGFLEFTLNSDNTHINSIWLNDLNGFKIKGVELVKENFPGDGYIYLDKIILKDESESIINEYCFSYYNDNYTIEANTLHTDYQGYLNGVNLDASYMSPKLVDIEPTTITGTSCTGLANSTVYYPDQINIGSGNKQPNLQYTKTFALEEITYPTGGKSSFIYELNQYNLNGAQDGCGLRIKQIIKFDPDEGEFKKKTYSYDPGILNFPPSSNYDYSYGTIILDCYSGTYCGTGLLPEFYYYSHRNRLFYNNILPPHLSGEKVKYKKIIEYSGEIDSNIGKVEYLYEYNNPHEYALLGDNYIREPFNFFNIPSEYEDIENNYEYIEEYKNWGNGTLKKEIVFKNNGLDYDTLSINEYNYEYIVSNSFDNLGYYYVVDHSCLGDGSLDEYYTFREETNNPIPFYDFADPLTPYNYSIKSGAYKLISKKNTQFNGQKYITSTEFLNYDNGLSKPLTSSEITGSTNKRERTEYLFPTDFENVQPYSNMLSQNMHNYPIEQITKTDGNITAATITTWKTDDGNYVPEKTYSLETTTPLSSFTEFDGNNKDSHYASEPEVEFIDYDKEGKLIKAKSKDGLYHYYVWAYNNEYPVAEIVSSENTTVSSSTIANIGGHSFTNSDTYNNIQTDVSYLQTQLSSYINNNDYIVTLYTYKPLIGMTSQTDSAGRTSYYEYDTFGRLKYTRDQNGNIVSKNEYHYAGQ